MVQLFRMLLDPDVKGAQRANHVYFFLHQKKNKTKRKKRGKKMEKVMQKSSLLIASTRVQKSDRKIGQFLAEWSTDALLLKLGFKPVTLKWRVSTRCNKTHQISLHHEIVMRKIKIWVLTVRNSLGSVAVLCLNWKALVSTSFFRLPFTNIFYALWHFSLLLTENVFQFSCNTVVFQCFKRFSLTSLVTRHLHTWGSSLMKPFSR